MKEFFYNLLLSLDKLTGLKQYEKLCQTPNPKEEIKLLLEILCRVTDMFPFIPDAAKKQIINDAVIVDPEFIGLNAKVIFKWLNVKKEFWTKETGEPEIHPEALTGEAREKRLKEWLSAINGMEMIQNSSEKFDYVKQIQPVDGQVYVPSERNEYEHQRHVEYLQDNYDARTGEKLPTWISEDDYNKVYDEVSMPKTDNPEEVKE